MPLYASAITEHTLLDAEGERRIAREIESLTEAIWAAALSHPALAEPAIEFMEGQLEPARRTFATLRRAARLAKRDRSQRPALERAAARAAPRLRLLDIDHRVIDGYLRALHHSLGHPGPLTAGVSRRALTSHLAKLDQRAKAATDARHRFAQANIGLVFHVASRYPAASIGLPDLVQEGTIGLIKAVDRYDFRRGFRFSTYATWWIRHAIGRALADKSRLVRVPVHIQEVNQRLNTARRKLTSELHREPSNDEIATAAGISRDKVDLVRGAIGGGEISLDERLGDEEDRSRIDVFTSPELEQEMPEDDLDLHTISEVARRHLERLSPQEADILRKRFGLGAAKREHSLQEIATEYGLSRERIRQIQERALDKLRRELAGESIDSLFAA